LNGSIWPALHELSPASTPPKRCCAAASGRRRPQPRGGQAARLLAPRTEYPAGVVCLAPSGAMLVGGGVHRVFVPVQSRSGQQWVQRAAALLVLHCCNAELM
jgi:hypothetical protein